MIAIVFGLVTAVLWATTLLGSAGAARLIGAWSTLAWVMLIGLAIAVPLVLLTGSSVNLTTGDLAALAVAGIANSGGLVLGYAALRRGKVGVVGPIIVGVIASAVSGYLAIAGLLKFVRTHSYDGFVVYRVLAGTTVLLLIATGVKSATF